MAGPVGRGASGSSARPRSQASSGGSELIGRSFQTASVRLLIEKAAKTPFAVLLLGETGTGKEVAARAIHRASNRADKPMVVVDCGSLVSTLAESELFGYVKGAFSGAIANKMGLMEVADGGTVFLDEIGDLPLEMQVKLLRVLQEGEFRPVGALYTRSVDIRFVAATNRDLAAEVEAGRFRMDLYQRLNVFPIHLSPLRERLEDIPLLVAHFVKQLEVMGFAPRLDLEMITALAEHSWPGNVRELKHCVERLIALELDNANELRGMLATAGAGSTQLGPKRSCGGSEHRQQRPEKLMSIPEGELHLISEALAATNGNRAKAADILRISRTTLYRRIRHSGVHWTDIGRPARAPASEVKRLPMAKLSGE